MEKAWNNSDSAECLKSARNLFTSFLTRAIVKCKERLTLGQSESVHAETVGVKLITEEVLQNRIDRAAAALARQKAGDCGSVGPVTLFPLGQ